MRDFPLSWQPGKPRTPPAARETSRFRMSFKSAFNSLFDEALRLHDGPDPFFISTNVPVSLKGTPVVSEAARVADPGVAVYVFRDGVPYGFCYDRFTEVRHNLRALAVLLLSMRKIADLGDVEMLRQSMIGFQREIAAPVWPEVLALRGRAA